MFHLTAVGVSEAHPEVPSQINPLPKEGNLVPVLLQPKIEDGVKVVQPAAMESPKVRFTGNPLLPTGKAWPLHLQHQVRLGVRSRVAGSRISPWQVHHSFCLSLAQTSQPQTPSKHPEQQFLKFDRQDDRIFFQASAHILKAGKAVKTSLKSLYISVASAAGQEERRKRSKCCILLEIF